MKAYGILKIKQIHALIKFVYCVMEYTICSLNILFDTSLTIYSSVVTVCATCLKAKKSVFNSQCLILTPNTDYFPKQQ